MDHLRVLAETQGYFTRPDALREGYDDNAIRRALKNKLWTRVRHGVYTLTELWAGAADVEQHLTTARAVARRLGNHVALSHTSAALDHGLTAWDVDLSRVHVTRLDGGAGRTEAGVVHHEGLSIDGDIVERDGYLVMKPARAALETCSLNPVESGVVLLDDGLHKQLFSADELDEVLETMRFWPGTLHLQFVVRFADGRAESVGESRSRFLCYKFGLPAPDLQFHVHDDHGTLVGITDFAWRDRRLLGEFDGKVKYGRLLKPGQEPGDVVFDEKVREDTLRRITGCSMVRLIWADLYRGPRTAARIRGLMSDQAA